MKTGAVLTLRISVYMRSREKHLLARTTVIGFLHGLGSELTLCKKENSSCADLEDLFPDIRFTEWLLLVPNY